MFALPTPYAAEREIFITNKEGGMTSTWEPCRVIGVTKDDEGDLVYIVEVTTISGSCLDVEPYVRRLP